MYNDLFSIGGLTVHGYGLCIGLGIAAALLLIWRRAEERKLDVKTVNTFCSFSPPALPGRSFSSFLRIGASFAPIRSARSARRALSSTAASCAASALRIFTAGGALSPSFAGRIASSPAWRLRRASGASAAFSPGAASGSRRTVFSAWCFLQEAPLRPAFRSGRCSFFRRRAIFFSPGPSFFSKRSAAATGCSRVRISFCTASAGF